MYSHMERPIKGPESCVGDLNKESGSNAESLRLRAEKSSPIPPMSNKRHLPC